VKTSPEARGRRFAGPAILAAILAAAPAAHGAEPGILYEAVETSTMPSPVRCLVVLPPSYDSSPGRRYPVLYFLHDGWGNGRTLERRGVAQAARRRMAEGRLPEFLIVAPDGPGSWFSNSHDGSRRFEDFLVDDLPRWVESRHRGIASKASRGITGISMGGYGSVKTALRHPDLYGSVSAISGALIPFDGKSLERYSWVARYTLKRVFGKDETNNTREANDAWHVLWGLCFEEPPFVAHMRGGTDDVYGLERVAVQYAMVLNERGVPTTVVLEPGTHDWRYWKRSMIDILAWHAERFEYDPR
jgi:S-formylglutathione hydrolase FrmB